MVITAMGVAMGRLIRRFMRSWFFFLLFLCTSLNPRAGIGEDLFQPNIKPTLHVTRTDEPIKIDGDLDDPGWMNAARADNFTQFTPKDLVKPPVGIEVLVTYDSDNLYVAYMAHDDPSAIRCSFMDRDEAYRDDYVGILFDTFGNNEWYYELFANPRGIQMDLRWTNGFDEDESFDLVWHSNGKITSDGFQVEMAIPFSSLRFPDTPRQTWSATFWWNSPRESRRRYSWAAISEDEPCFPCQFGTLTGIENVSPGSPMELLPSLVASSSRTLADDAGQGLTKDDFDGDVSLGVNYALSSSLSAQATYNPDFSQIESDAGQIDVNTTFALFYPERRPFFQESSDLFQTWIDAVYTRSINDPVFAGKATSRLGRTGISYIAARDDNSPIVVPLEEGSEILSAGKSTSNIVRLRSSIGEDAFIGGLVTDRRLDGGGSGTVFSSDLSVRFLKNYRFKVQGLGSYTRELDDATLNEDLPDTTFDGSRHTVFMDGEKYWGHAAYAGLSRSARTWNWDLDYFEYSPTVRTDNGFVTRNNYREGSLWTGFMFRPDGKIVESFQLALNFGRMWNFEDERKDEWIEPRLWVQLKSQTQLSSGLLFSREVFKGIVFDDIRRWDFSLYSAFSDPVQVDFYIASELEIARNLSDPVLGNGLNVEANATIKPFQRLVIQPGWQYSRLSYQNDGPEIFRAYIVRSRISYQFTRALFARLVVEYFNLREINGAVPPAHTQTSSLSIEPLLTYRVNPFTTFYLGSNHGSEDLDERADGNLRPTSRQFFMKLQYLFRI
jgi:hypothetical protein